MNPQNPRPAEAPATAELNTRILNAVAASRWQGRLLTGFALVFGLLSIAASIATVLGYLFLYRPKENQLLMDYGAIVRAAGANPSAEDRRMVETPDGRRFDALGVQLTLGHAIAFGAAMVAVSVALLGAGTLVTVTLVIFHRRVTLRQVNASLAQISEQLRELRSGTSTASLNG